MEGTKLNKYPKLRFLQFSSSWEEMVLSDVVAFSKGSSLSKADLSTEGKPCILYGELYTRYDEVIKKVVSRTSRDDKKLVLGHLNDVIIPSSGETAVDIACAAALQVNEVILGGDLNILRPKKAINGSFLSYELNHSRKKELMRVAQGATVVHLYNGNLKSISVCMTSEEEQQKIASFFSLLDQKIDMQQEKIEQLELFKKGMMQKIFSQEIRFKDEDGGEFPEWSTGRIKDIASIKLRPIPKPEISYWRLGLRSHAKGTFHTLVTDPSTVNMDTLYLVEKGDLIVNITFAWEQAIAIADELDCGKLVSHRFPTYVFNKDKAVTNFYKYYLTRRKVKYDLSNASPGGAGRNRVLNKNEFMKIEVSIPSVLEQQKIAFFLTNLDYKLEREKEKLEALQQQKKGFLQQMFI